MSDLTKRRSFFRQTRFTETARIPLRLTTIVTCLLLTIMPLLSGCGGGGETGSEPSAAPVGAAVSLSWWRVYTYPSSEQPFYDPSITAYVIHYGRQSPGQPGSCAYESSMHVDSMHGVNTETMVTNLDPNTHYYFAVSAYNGIESPCSSEVSTITPPASV